MNEQRRDLPDWLRPRNEIEALLLDLRDALSAWRKTKEARYVAEYHNVYRRLCSLGWDEDLDLEMLLPDALMPRPYTSHYWNYQIDDAAS